MTLIDIEKQIQATKSHVEKALAHLEYSLNKINLIQTGYDIEDYEILEIS